MSKRNFIWALLVIVLLYTTIMDEYTSSAYAQTEIVDQAHLAGLTGSYATIGSGRDWAQTVTPNVSGFLTKIDLSLAAWDNPAEMVIEIRSISGGFPTETVLASTTFSASSSSFTWYSISIPSQPYFAAGTPFAIVMRPNTGRTAIAASTNNDYLNGWAISRTTGSTDFNLSAGSAYDFGFRSYVIPQEPTATRTNTPSNTPSNTITNTPTNTVTNTPSNTPTYTATNTQTSTPSNTPTYTATNTQTSTPSNTPTYTATNTQTSTPSTTPSNTPTHTETTIPSNTPSNMPTYTATNTETTIPSNTATHTATNTATHTPTQTMEVRPTHQRSPTPQSSSQTATVPIPSPSSTSQPSPSPSATIIPSLPPEQSSYQIYLPRIGRDADRPDLVATINLEHTDAVLAGEPLVLSITITNQGTVASTGFWVDLYINPLELPSSANQTWDKLCEQHQNCYGLAWYVDALEAGEQITRSSAQFEKGYGNWPGWLPAGSHTLYAYTDSWNPGVDDGAVKESNEDNNRAQLNFTVK